MIKFCYVNIRSNFLSQVDHNLRVKYMIFLSRKQLSHSLLLLNMNNILCKKNRKVWKFYSLKFLLCINFAISLLFPHGKEMTLHLNKFESPSPKDVLCLVLLKLAQRFWRRFLIFVNLFSLFLLLSPLRKRHDPSFEKT